MKVIFLDRDGVINEYPGDGKYVTRWEEFKFIPGSKQAIREFNQAGFKVFVISNQAGVSKGIYSFQDLQVITRKMIASLKKEKAHLDGVYYCPHQEKDNCNCRKPKDGLLKKALSEFRIKPKISFFIGDSFLDMKAAKNFGIKGVLLLSGKEKMTNRKNWEFTPDYIFDNLLSASRYICSHYGR